MHEFIEQLKQILSGDDRKDLLEKLEEFENEYYKLNYIRGCAAAGIKHPDEIFLNSSDGGMEQLSEKLIEQEKRFRMLINYGSDVILVVDAKGRPSFVSDNVVNALGYSIDEVLHSFAGEVIHPEDSKGFKRAMLESLKNPGKHIHYEGRFKHRDGSWKWISANGANFLNDPVLKGVLVNFHEITKRKMIEKALLESEEKLRLIVDHTPEAIVVYKDDIIIFANPSSCRLLKAEDTEQLIGLPVIQIIHPDYLENVRKHSDDAFYSRGEMLIPVERKFICLDGSVIDVEVSTTCIIYEGQEAYLSIIHDIGFRKQMEQKLRENEERYRAIVENIPDAVFVHRDGDIIYINKSGARMIRAANPQQLSGLPIFTFIHSDSVESVNRHLKEATAYTGQISMPEDLKYIALDGAVINVEAATSVVMYDGQKSFLTIAHDISERKRIERLREDTERIIRHDLKSPLNAIIGFSQLLLSMDNPSSVNVSEWSKAIYNGGMKMLHMINHSLDLFKMEEGTYKLKYEDVNLLKLFDDLEKEFIPMLEEKSLVMICMINNENLKCEGSYCVVGQELHLKTLFSNLIKNAIEATPPENKITISINQKRNNFHEIDIHNRGAVPESIRDKFFDRYSTCGKNDGTGIGTYSAYLIAKTHGGNITFSTSEEEGTHVTVFLPKVIQDKKMEVY